jgi:hypothetical protein
LPSAVTHKTWQELLCRNKAAKSASFRIPRIASTAITFVASLDSVATSDSAEMGGSGDSTAVVDASDTSYSGAGGSRFLGSHCSGLKVQQESRHVAVPLLFDSPPLFAKTRRILSQIIKIRMPDLRNAS